jgi:N-carbamoyl-L-amino-acid hydrolase
MEANAEFGAIETTEGQGYGRTTLTATDADRAARERFVEQLRELGLTVRIDPIGNIAGRWVTAETDTDAAPVAVGSHLDSVPEGGIFDGPLGAYAGIEVVRTMQDADIEPTRPVDVVSWTEEEGARFGTGLLGSSVAAGVQSLEAALGLRDDDGNRLGAELEQIGFAGDETIDPSTWDAWFELHIEQGTELESSGASAGVIEAISGISNCRVSFDGEADHAGATPMNERRDALTAASEFVLDNRRAARNAVVGGNERAVSTVGKMELSPNGNNIVPGNVEIIVDTRDVTRGGIQEIVDTIKKDVRRIGVDHPVDITFNQYRLTEPSQMADKCVELLSDAAERFGVNTDRMHSPALHDTANVANVTDTGLLFAPSRDGLSHNPLEWTDWDDCANAAQVLTGAVTQKATQ